MKRTPLRRRTPLRSRAAPRRARPARAATPGAALQGHLNGPVPMPPPAGERPERSRYRGRERHVDYMLWVKRQPCLMRGVWGTCSGRVEADHAGRRGAGRKAHDSTCIPLCHCHHQASRFPRAWTQDQRRAWLRAAVVYTQACARAAGVVVPVDPAPVTRYPATPVDAARAELAAVAANAAHESSLVGCAGGT